MSESPYKTVSVVAVLFLVVAVALYAGEYWFCVRPCRCGSYRMRPVYSFGDTAAGRTLRILYAPVLFCESAKVYDWGDPWEEWMDEYSPNSQAPAKKR